MSHGGDAPNHPVSARGARGRRHRRAPAQHRAFHSSCRRRHRCCACSRPAADRAGSGSGAARHPAAADLFGGRGDELARIPFQPAPDYAARFRLRLVHRRRGSGGRALPARHALGRRLRARRHRGADRRGRPARGPPSARLAAPAYPRARGRRSRQRRHGFDPLPLCRRRGRHRPVLLRRSRRNLCPHRRRRNRLWHRHWLGQPAFAPLGARSARRDHAVADDALCGVSGPRASGRIRRLGDGSGRPVRQLERTAAHSGGDAAAGHLLLGPASSICSKASSSW